MSMSSGMIQILDWIFLEMMMIQNLCPPMAKNLRKPQQLFMMFSQLLRVQPPRDQEKLRDQETDIFGKAMIPNSISWHDIFCCSRSDKKCWPLLPINLNVWLKFVNWRGFKPETLAMIITNMQHFHFSCKKLAKSWTATKHLSRATYLRILCWMLNCCAKKSRNFNKLPSERISKTLILVIIIYYVHNSNVCS